MNYETTTTTHWQQQWHQSFHWTITPTPPPRNPFNPELAQEETRYPIGHFSYIFHRYSVHSNHLFFHLIRPSSTHGMRGTETRPTVRVLQNWGSLESFSWMWLEPSWASQGYQTMGRKLGECHWLGGLGRHPTSRMTWGTIGLLDRGEKRVNGGLVLNPRLAPHSHLGAWALWE